MVKTYLWGGDLTLTYSGIIPGISWGSMCLLLGIQTKMSCVQDKCLKSCTITQVLDRHFQDQALHIELQKSVASPDSIYART